MKRTRLLTSRFLAEYSRRPLNLVLLAAVPLIFVTLSAGAIADFADTVGGVGSSDALAAPTAGWAAAFIAGVAGFFHVLGSRRADHRLAAAGMGPRQILTGRLLSGLGLVLVASAAAIAGLAIRGGLFDPVRVVAGTAMFAIIYFAIGVAIGVVVKSEVNGSLIVVFIWMLDVFLGPAMAGGGVWITRLFPSHFLTLVMLDAGSGHAGPLGDLGLALLWVVGALVLAAGLFATRTGAAKTTNRRGDRDSAWARVSAGLRFGLRDYRRNIAMWVLMVILPVFFISLSFYITPNDPAPVELTTAGVTQIQIMSMADVHGAIMVPITIGFLAGLAGLFVVQGSREADARLALSGFRPAEILTARLGVITLAGLLATVVAVAVTALDFSAVSWGWFGFGNLLVAVTYAMVGVIVGAIFGPLGGLYVMFLLPFIDIGLAQNVMFSAAPPGWGAFLPGRGAVDTLIDGAFTPTFDQMGGLILALAWLIGLTAVSALVFRRMAAPAKA